MVEWKFWTYEEGVSRAGCKVAKGADTVETAGVDSRGETAPE